MTPTNPPRIATWLLEHMPPSEHDDALAGDLLEEFRCGRSTRWYWRQVLAAIAIGCCRNVLNHRTVLAFAALWSMLAPAWLLTVANIEEHFNFNQRIWQMDFPWSTVCDVGALLAADLIFIWAGILLYLIPHLWATRSLRVRHLGRGIVASVPVLLALWAALVLLPKVFLAQSQPVDQPFSTPLSTYMIKRVAPLEVERMPPQETWSAQYGDKPIEPHSSPRNAIADMRPSAILVRLPFFLSVLCTLWAATSRFHNRRNGIAA